MLAANLRRTQLRSELNEIEGQHDSTNSENVALKRDKLLLTDEVANLNAKVQKDTFSFKKALKIKGSFKMETALSLSS